MVTGRAKQIDGKQAHINIDGEVHASSKVLTVTTVGKGDLTAAESYKEDVVLKALQGTITLTEHPFFCSIWAPSLNVSWPSQDTSITSVIDYPDSKLNSSQSVAVERIISQSDTDRVLLIHGPPGTGKTTVIAASVNSIIKTGPKERTIWLVAQSNVAVRNIAEKLDKVGFRDFKLLVSKDFHYDWHEDLYQSLEHCFIRSDLFGGSVVEISRLLLDARVILCTLSMLSNPNIDTITRIVSVQTVIFDEASQIEVGDYVPLLQRFQHSLEKMVFIGDDKQHRMPVVIGDFISDHVYNKKLKTKHDDTSKTTCRFLDVKMGREESVGHSWINQKEISAVIGLARLYETQGKKFKIITPYDAQRTRIEEQLKSEKLRWEDKCFNVDSFQGKIWLTFGAGNEEDHIIVSLVRSEGVGFLKNMRRTNVMLTRCKKSMIICTSRDFVTRGQAAGTLVGKLAATMGPQAWQDSVAGFGASPPSEGLGSWRSGWSSVAGMSGAGPLVSPSRSWSQKPPSECLGSWRSERSLAAVLSGPPSECLGAWRSERSLAARLSGPPSECQGSWRSERSLAAGLSGPPSECQGSWRRAWSPGS
ncbi:hypothetical protein P692DRAFT_20742909 [Suillus brevipes Sb2]|nr:hypothetical protein P692DRAFT_20742909 [Suillus brevipes Sb2]